MLGDGAGVNLEDVQTSLFIRQFDIYNTVGDFQVLVSHIKRNHVTSLIPHTLTDFAVEPAGPQQGRVQSVGSVGGHDHLDSVEGVKAVHLVQQLTGREQEQESVRSAQIESGRHRLQRGGVATPSSDQ